jgi:hypothetical protein
MPYLRSPDETHRLAIFQTRCRECLALSRLPSSGCLVVDRTPSYWLESLRAEANYQHEHTLYIDKVKISITSPVSGESH